MPQYDILDPISLCVLLLLSFWLLILLLFYFFQSLLLATSKKDVSSALYDFVYNLELPYKKYIRRVLIKQELVKDDVCSKYYTGISHLIIIIIFKTYNNYILFSSYCIIS